VARARAPVAVTSGRARNQRRSRCRSGRRRTRTDCRLARGSGGRTGRPAKRPASAWTTPPRRTYARFLALPRAGRQAGRDRSRPRAPHDPRVARRLRRRPTPCGPRRRGASDARAFRPSNDVELLCELASRDLPEGQALHGDAHLFNCIQTAAGPIWHDLETACRGPREYDLAALVLDDRSDGSDPEAQSAIAAYGSYDQELLDQALPVYAAWLAASFMVAVARRPDAAPALERQLQFLRRFRH
jgi:Ser/Thr protein kinase RdoA (MazF antagonist)